MKLLIRFQDTRNNNEDFALTPFLFGVYCKEEVIKVYGLGICWGWWAAAITIGFNVPKEVPIFKVFDKK